MLLIKSALHAAKRKCVVDDEVETFRTEMWTHPNLSFAVKLTEFNVNGVKYKYLQNLVPNLLNEFEFRNNSNVELLRVQ